jgi:hypothetical protein
LSQRTPVEVFAFWVEMMKLKGRVVTTISTLVAFSAEHLYGFNFSFYPPFALVRTQALFAPGVNPLF